MPGTARQTPESRGARAALDFGMRSVVILARLLPFVLSVLRDHRGWLVAGRPVARSAEFHRRRAAAIVHAVAELGPTFVKLAQILSARPDLIPEPYLSALGTLTDRVPPISYEAVEATIRDQYGAGPDDLFERFDREPLAAASLGQVHRARYQGRDVVVKVLRPGVEALVDADIRAARKILDVVVPRWPNRHIIALQTVISEFSARVHEEMDFRKEAAYAEEIGRNFAGHRAVVVPAVVQEMTRQRTLVLQYLEGRRIDAVADWIAQGKVRPRALVSTVMELYIQMMLVDGLFHADPHPGNLLVAPDGRLILLDFGMVVRVPRQLRVDLVDTVFASIRQDVPGILRGFRALGLIEPDADLGVLEDLAHRLLALATMRATVEERIETLLADDVMRELYEAPVTLPSEMVYFARTAALIEGLGVRYDPYFQAIEFATPLALKMRGRIMRSLRGDQPMRKEEEWAADVGALLGAVAGVVERAGREIAAIFGSSLFGGTPATPATPAPAPPSAPQSAPPAPKALPAGPDDPEGLKLAS